MILKQRGVALITVMLIVALCAVIASQMTARLQMQMQRSINISFNQQAYWYAMGAEAFTKRVLITAFEEDKDIIHLGQAWASGETTYPVDFGEITGEITDLHSCLNLNALRAPLSSSSTSGSSAYSKKVIARIVLEELLVALNIDDVSSFEAESMADSLTDWLDENSAISSNGGAEDNDYASHEFPYLAANHFLASVNELRLVENFSVKTIQALKPYVCVLPQSLAHKININTLDAEKPELLQALLGSTLSQAQNILSARPEEGFKTVTEFYNLPELSNITLDDEQKKQFVVNSEYFTLKATASFNNSYFMLNSVMQVIDNKKINVISRTIGHN